MKTLNKINENRALPLESNMKKYGINIASFRKIIYYLLSLNSHR